MGSQRRAGVILGYANIIVKNLVNLVYTPMLLSFVGQADYGVFQTANSFVFSLTILSCGFNNAYIRFYMQRRVENGEDGVRSLNGVYLAFYGVVCSVALALGLVFAANVETFFSGSFTPGQVGLAGNLMAIMAASVAVTLFSTVFDAYIMACEQFRFQQTRQMFAALATPVAALVLLNLGMGVVGVALAQLAVNVILLALNARCAVTRLGMRFSLRHLDGGLFRAIAVFSVWLFLNQVCELANQSLPNVFLAALSSAVAASVFAASIQIRQVFYSLSMAISSVFIPEINRIVADSNDDDVLTRLMTRIGRYQAVVYLWVLGGFAVLGRFFVSKWAGAGFADAYWLVLLMATPLFIPLVQNTGIEIQRAKNRHKARSAAYLLMAALNVALTVLLAPSLGYWAPAIGYMAYVVLGTGVFMNWYYQKRIGLDMLSFWRNVLPAVGAGALATAACLIGTSFAPVADWLTFILWGAVYTLIYLVLTAALVLTEGERAEMARRLRLPWA